MNEALTSLLAVLNDLGLLWFAMRLGGQFHSRFTEIYERC